jgi:hypothetical protein
MELVVVPQDALVYGKSASAQELVFIKNQLALTQIDFGSGVGSDGITLQQYRSMLLGLGDVLAGAFGFPVAVMKINPQLLL